MNREELLKIAKPILFNTKMVQAILDGRKSVTRRIVKPHYKDDEYGFRVCTNEARGERWVEKINEDGGSIFLDGTVRYVKPTYKVGDILYVRETFSRDFSGNIVFKADDEFANYLSENWRPSIHMPKEAARIFLKVTNVRVEQVKDITEEQAIAEGFISRKEFMETFLKIYPNCTEESYVWVIEFERVEVEE